MFDRNQQQFAAVQSDPFPSKRLQSKTAFAWVRSSVIARDRANGSTLQELADRFGVSVQTIANIEAAEKQVRHPTKAQIKAELERNEHLRKAAADYEKAWHEDQARIRELEAELKTERAEHAMTAAHSANLLDRAEQADKLLEVYRVNEQALIDRLNDRSMESRWQNEARELWADLESAEALLDDMRAKLLEARTQLSEARARKWWQLWK